MTQSNPATVSVWDGPLRLFHWLLAGVITVAFLSAIEGNPLAPWHQAAGWAAAVLIVFRLVWGFLGGEHARFADFLGFKGLGRHLSQLARGRIEPSLGHNPLGALAIVGLLGLAAVAIVSGAQLAGGGEDDLHEAVALALLGMVAVHVVAVAVMSRMSGENLARAMVTGRKPAALHPGAQDARRARTVGVAMAVLVAGAAAYGATRIDANAFGPHAQSEAGEGPGGQEAEGERD
jgi:cytochrome b